jgi:hypothetical protein
MCSHEGRRGIVILPGAIIGSGCSSGVGRTRAAPRSTG